MTTASAPVMPAAPTQSVAEMRTDIGFASGHAARTASNTASGNRMRFSRLPPWSSVRRLLTGVMKLDNR